jgi:hypothetical protein
MPRVLADAHSMHNMIQHMTQHETNTHNHHPVNHHDTCVLLISSMTHPPRQMTHCSLEPAALHTATEAAAPHTQDQHMRLQHISLHSDTT